MREGGITTEDSGGWLFTKPDGQSCQPWVSDDNLAGHLEFALRKRQRAQRDQLAAVDSFQHPHRSNDPAPLARFGTMLRARPSAGAAAVGQFIKRQ